MRDLVTYDVKHNNANGEANRDGSDDNRSWNCGVEGPTDDPEINALRLKQQKNFLATLMLSQGVPMIAHGDELGRTQLGNNNVYAQDNELSWVDWDLDTDEKDLLDFTTQLIELRKNHNVFRRRRFFAGDADHGGQSDLGDIVWYAPMGMVMDEDAWRSHFARSIMVFLNGEAIAAPDERGRPVTDDHFLLLFNASHESVDFTIPEGIDALSWNVVVDTTGAAHEGEWETGQTYPVPPASVIVLTATPQPGLT